MICEKILQGITNEREDQKEYSPIRMSSSGKCQRAIAYGHHGFKSEPLPARAIMVFRLGDTVETEIKALIEKYCKDISITYPKETVSFDVNGYQVPGHVDGLIGDDTVLEIKSINGMRFKFLDREGIPEEYKAQACAYMHALKRKKTLFIFYCKDTSHLKEMWFEYDSNLLNKIKQRFSNVLSSTKDELPDREYGPNEKGRLPWQCSYCSYNQHCWPEAETKFDKQNKTSMWVEVKK